MSQSCQGFIWLVPCFFSEELFQQNKEDECLPSVLYDLFYIFLVIYIVNNLMKVGSFCCCAGDKFCTP